jgi:AraC-like DNA-binding protein/ligand-binding sensor protein
MEPSHISSSSHSSSEGSNHRRDNVVSRLQQSEIFRDYQDAFQTATGLPLVLREAGSFQPPLHGARQTNAFCGLMSGASRTCAACLQVQQAVEQDAGAAGKTVQCFAGLSESVVPVRVGETIIAYLQTGQVLMRAPTERGFRTAVAQLEKWKATVDVALLHAAYFETRVLPKARYGAALRLLASFAQHLSLLSNELMIKTASSEPPAAVKARAYIAEHLGEALTLEQVARAANMSAFYFCKVFKAATGLTFTNYVARARIEKTKQLLLNPHVRISEAAYEAGFQSLSQFNRVFRRVAGESPSTYRDHLHGTSSHARPSHAMAFAA